jgi:hypothetical protein
MIAMIDMNICHLFKLKGAKGWRVMGFVFKKVKLCHFGTHFRGVETYVSR